MKVNCNFTRVDRLKQEVFMAIGCTECNLLEVVDCNL